MPRLLFQGRKPNRRKQNKPLQYFGLKSMERKKAATMIFFFYDVYIIFTTIKETIKKRIPTTLYLYFNLIK